MSDSEDNMTPEPPVIDPYEVLGLERTATPDQIKKAYRKASLRTHPGKSSLVQTRHVLLDACVARYS